MNHLHEGTKNGQKALQDEYPYLSINDFSRGLLRHDGGGDRCLKLPGFGGLEISYEVNLDESYLEFYGTTKPLYGFIRLRSSESSFGIRPWLACPSCGKRRGKLYKSGKGFSCRICLNLTYASTRFPRNWPIFSLFSKQMRLTQLAEKVKRITYGGQLTRRARRVMTLSKALQVDLDGQK